MTQDRTLAQAAKRLPLIVLGAVLAAYSLLAEVFGFGAPGFGTIQTTLLVVAVLMLLVGIFPRAIRSSLGSRQVHRAAAGIRAAWCVLGISLVAIWGAEMVLRVLFAAEKQRIEDFYATGHRHARADGYHGAEWAKDYYREARGLTTEWRPYVEWRCKPFQGRYINVDENGLRRTWTPQVTSRRDRVPRPKIFFFGGSTVWGSGVRDEHTLPSCVARRLSEAGYLVDVSNFGESGYQSTQEVITLLRELQKGNAPDIAVFYDGINDVRAAYQHRTAGLTARDDRRRAEHNLLRDHRRLRNAYLKSLRRQMWGFDLATAAVRRRIWPSRPKMTPHPERAVPVEDDLEQEVLQVYEANMKTVEGVAQVSGMTTRFYWQPVIFTKKRPTRHETQEARRHAYLGDFHLGVYDRVRSMTQWPKDHPFRDLSATLDDVEGPCYLDYCHITEEGNDLIAREIVKDLIPILQKRRGGKRPTPRGEGSAPGTGAG